MRMAAAQHVLANDSPAMTLRRVDPSRNMSRFWSARLLPSLFEELLLVRARGPYRRSRPRAVLLVCNQTGRPRGVRENHRSQVPTWLRRLRGAHRRGAGWAPKYPPGSHGVERPREAAPA